MLVTNAVVQFFIAGVLVLCSIDALAYGGGGGAGSSCKKPVFSAMTPPKSTVVSSGAEISFVAWGNTSPKSIQVSAKGKKVELKIAQKKPSGKITVTGRLPEDLEDGHVLVKISAKSSASCQAQDGWLLKIGSD